MSGTNSTALGNALEVQIYSLLEAEIENDRFWARKSCCKLFRKKGYHSRDRNAQIVFDISVEIYLPGAQEYSMVFLVECKNYSDAVPVNDVEEFFAKVQQVAASNAKAVIASTAAFQAGSRAFAQAKGIGLLRYFGGLDFKWELLRSASTCVRSTNADAASLIEDGLSLTAFRSDVFDLYMQSPVRVTNSLWDFAEDLAVSRPVDEVDLSRVANSRAKLVSQVPFIEKEELEARADEVRSSINYSYGEVALDAIFAKEAERCKLVVTQEAAPGTKAMLGRITFKPLHIRLYWQEMANHGRDRFTLAHELAHHLLNHGRYMAGEFCVESDFSQLRRRIDDGTDIARMEFQANYFASSLLMPRSHFGADFWRVFDRLGLIDRGFGPLYLDSQPCNIQSFKAVTANLGQEYGVSVTAAKVRLETLGLLRDARSGD